MKRSLSSLCFALFVLVSLNCSKNKDSATTTTPVPDIYKKIYGASDMYVDGDYIVIKTKDLPDHKSPYYASTQWQATMYEAYNGSNASYFSNNAPIRQQNLTFRIPLKPAMNAAHRATPLGPMGVSLNGVPFFNQYAGNGSALGPMELNTFDQYNGHATPQDGSYHYHAEPLWLTANKGRDALLGFLLDGFPVYGPLENGRIVANADLDAYHGHTSATADYPSGIYHYHVTSADPYINGNGFYGTPGTVSQ